MYEKNRKSTGSVFLMASKCLFFTFRDLEKHLNVVQETSVNKSPPNPAPYKYLYSSMKDKKGRNKI